MLILLMIAGRPCNGPNHTRNTSAPRPMRTSLATAAAVIHHGTRPSQAASMNTVISNNLSAQGSRNFPSSEVQLNRLARYPSSPSEAAASMKRPSASRKFPAASAAATGQTSASRRRQIRFGICRTARLEGRWQQRLNKGQEPPGS